jgi:Mg-chelatase subunit ChlD
LKAFLNKLLTKDDGTYLVAYDDDVHKLSEVVSDAPGISEAFDKLKNLKPRGSTALYDAIQASSQNFKGRSGRRILIVVGDWEDNSSHVLDGEALKAAQRTATTIYAILDSDNSGIDSKKSRKRAVQAATELTEQTGGQSMRFERKMILKKCFRQLGLL